MAATTKSNPYATTELKGGSATSTYYSHPLGNFGWQPYPSGSSSGTTSGVDPLNLQGAVNDLLGFQGDAAMYAAAAEGSRYAAEGAGIEADAYRVASGIAEENARTEVIAESIRQVQIAKDVDRTVGSIKAATAANGFQQSGSSLDIMASTMREGYLSQQISGMQSQQTQRGHLEQQAAAEGEMGAALVRQEAALSLAEAQDQTALSATANEAALTSALTQLLAGDENATQLVSDLTAGDTSAVLADVLLYNPNGADAPLITAEPPTNTADNDFATTAGATDIMGAFG